MKTIVHETQVFGPITLYSQYLETDTVRIEKCENYQKRSARNRYDILTSNGVMTLTVPLEKGKNKQMPIRDVKVSYDEKWYLNHCQSIRSAYGKSPYFEFYYDKIEQILSTKHRFLIDLNQESLEFSIKNLKLNLKIEDTSAYLDYTSIDEIKDLRNLNTKPMDHNKKYIQVWEEKYEFQPNLSILDLLFCMGPEASSYL